MMQCVRRMMMLAVCALVTLAPHPASAAEGGAEIKPNANLVEPFVTAEEASLLAALTVQAEKDRSGAIAALRTALVAESSPALDFALGVFLSQADRHAEAEKAYRAAVAKAPRFRRAWKGVGGALLHQDKPEPAAAAFMTALRIGGDPDEERLWKLVGYCHLQAGHALEAETAYRQALLAAPRDREALTGAAKALLAGDRLAEAVPLLARLRDERPAEADAWLLLANAEMGLGKTASAARTLEGARRMGVLTPEGQLALGDLFYNMELYADAFARYDEACASDSVTAARTLRCAEAAFAVDRLDKARAYLALAGSRGAARHADALHLAGRIAERDGDTEAARRAYAEAIGVQPLHGRALLSLGRLCEAEGKDEEAAISYERAARLEGTRHAALLALAQWHARRRDFRKAIDFAAEAHELRPDRATEKYIASLRRVARAAL